MNTLKPACIGQFGQVAADRLQRHAKVLGKILDGHLALAACELEDFGATLTQAEILWLMDHEFACTAEDVLWRRSKLDLRLSQERAATLDDDMTDRRAKVRATAAE